MSENEFLLITFVASVAGGALGARQCRAAPWKGALIIFAASLVSGGLMFAFAVENVWISTVIALIAAGLVGSALQVQPRQTSMVVIGAILVSIITTVAVKQFA